MKKRMLALVLALLVGISALPALENMPLLRPLPPGSDLRALKLGSDYALLAMAVWQNLLLFAQVDHDLSGSVRLALYDPGSRG